MARQPRRPIRIGPRTNVHREPGAWLVTVIRQGRRFTDYFGDGVWGGKQRALVAAQRFRDQVLMRVEPDTRVRRRPLAGKGRRTGVVGVNIERHEVGGRVYERYVASWPEPGTGFARRRFLVGRYGRERALALAIEAREEGVARYHAYLLIQQRLGAKRRLRKSPPMPRQLKDPLDRKGISMARRRPRAGK